jgi:transposase
MISTSGSIPRGWPRSRLIFVAQSLLATCRLQDINPYAYLVDVLQRINHHSQSRILELTLRLWKQKFANNPLRSMVDLSAS